MTASSVEVMAATWVADMTAIWVEVRAANWSDVSEAMSLLVQPAISVVVRLGTCVVDNVDICVMLRVMDSSTNARRGNDKPPDAGEQRFYPHGTFHPEPLHDPPSVMGLTPSLTRYG